MSVEVGWGQCNARCLSTASARKANEIYNRDAELAEDVEREREREGGW